MVYRKNFVAVIKVDGKVLRERDDNTVYLPFGKEFSVSLKNLDSRKALAKISIGGTEAGELIVHPNRPAELERFIEDSLEKGHKFRFIQKTQEISDYRGDRLDDGLVRIEYQFEQTLPQQTITWSPPVVREHHHFYHHEYLYPFSQPWEPVYGTITCNDRGRGSCCGNITVQSNNVSMASGVSGFQANYYAAPNPDEGITVKGSESQQRFVYDNIGLLEEPSQVIVLRLRGYQPNQAQVSQPLTIQTKLICPTCGHTAKSSAKFCSNCSTALV
jgi:hypothetical protein